MIFTGSIAFILLSTYNEIAGANTPSTKEGVKAMGEIKKGHDIPNRYGAGGRASQPPEAGLRNNGGRKTGGDRSPLPPKK